MEPVHNHANQGSAATAFNPGMPPSESLKTRSFEDKILLIFRILGALALAASGAAALAFSAVPLAIALAAIGSGLLFLGFFDEIFSRMPVKVAYLAFFIKAFVLDLLVVLPFGISYLKNQENMEGLDPGKRTVVLIHGFSGHSSNWNYIRTYLHKRHEYNIVCINLGHPYKDIATYTEIARKKIKKIIEKTRHAEIDIVGHSMGGVIAREYLHQYAEVDRVVVQRIVTVGSPLAGSKVSSAVAYMLRAPALFEMGWQSNFMRRALQRQGSLCRFYHIGSPHDALVPKESSVDIPQEKHQASVHVVNGVGHLRLLISSEVAVKVADTIHQPLFDMA